MRRSEVRSARRPADIEAANAPDRPGACRCSSVGWCSSPCFLRRSPSVFPSRDNASVRSQRVGCYIMPGSGTVPRVPILDACSDKCLVTSDMTASSGTASRSGTSVNPRVSARPISPFLFQRHDPSGLFGWGLLCLCAREAEVSVITPHAQQHHPDPARKSNRRAFFPTPPGHTPCPRGQPAGSGSIQHHSRSLIKCGAQACISGACNLPDNVSFT